MKEGMMEEANDIPTMYITPVCPICGEPGSILLTDDQMARLNSDRLIQEALPELSDDQRELIKTGIHPACWPTEEEETE